MDNNREVWLANTGETVQRTQYYPSGLPWADGLNPEAQNKKYNGKEFVEAHGLDEYDSEARWYYPAIMRTTTLDPLAEKYYSISPYAWCGNNPVNRIDPSGAKWDSISNITINQTVGNVNSTISSLRNQITAINTTATDEKGKINLSEEQKNTIDELNYRINDLTTALNEIDNMTKDENYIFSLSSQSGTYAEMPVPSADKLNNITINYLSGDVGNMLHEIKHGYQVMNGDIIYSVNNGTVNRTLKAGVSLNNLEIAAYNTQYSYNGKLTGWQTPPVGSSQAIINQKFNLAGVSQVNVQYLINNHTQINSTWIKSIQKQAIGNNPLY